MRRSQNLIDDAEQALAQSLRQLHGALIDVHLHTVRVAASLVGYVDRQPWCRCVCHTWSRPIGRSSISSLDMTTYLSPTQIALIGSSRVSWSRLAADALAQAITEANASRVGLWLDVPTLADDDYVTRAATMCHESLEGTLYVSLSPAAFDGGSDQHHVMNTLGAASAAPGANRYAQGASWHVTRALSCYALTAAVYGPSASARVLRVYQLGCSPGLQREALGRVGGDQRIDMLLGGSPEDARQLGITSAGRMPHGVVRVG